MTNTYYSKVSYGLLAAVCVVFFAPIVLNIFIDGITTSIVFIGVTALLLFGFILHSFFNTTYTIEGDKLKIKSGFFNYKPIAISEIKEIAKSSNISSSPAASFNRIEIRYGKFEEVIISPKNKFELAKHLTALNPKIKNRIEG